MNPVTDNDFHDKIRESDGASLVMFTGSWCQPCQRLKPVVQDLKKQMNEEFELFEMDIEQAEKTAHELSIRSVPSLVLFSNGMVQDILTGTYSKTDLRLWIQENL